MRDRENIEREAEKLLRQHYFSSSSFVDLSVILEKEKINLIELEKEKWDQTFKEHSRFKDAEAILYLKKESKTIILNLNRVKNIRTSVAHEIGHFILHNDNDKESTIICHHGEGSYEDREKENAADYFAACLLMPKEAVINLTKKYVIPSTKVFSEIFRVEEEMVRRRFGELGILNA